MRECDFIDALTEAEKACASAPPSSVPPPLPPSFGGGRSSVCALRLGRGVGLACASFRREALRRNTSSRDC